MFLQYFGEEAVNDDYFYSFDCSIDDDDDLIIVDDGGKHGHDDDDDDDACGYSAKRPNSSD